MARSIRKILDDGESARIEFAWAYDENGDAARLGWMTPQVLFIDDGTWTFRITEQDCDPGEPLAIWVGLQRRRSRPGWSPTPT